MLYLSRHVNSALVSETAVRFDGWAGRRTDQSSLADAASR
jgi:hypothetical protein